MASALGLMTLDEVALRLDVCYETARKLVERGEIAGFKIGGQWKVALEDLRAYCDSVRSRPSGEEDDGVAQGAAVGEPEQGE